LLSASVFDLSESSVFKRVPEGAKSTENSSKVYGGDYEMALEELLKANQNDAFIQCLIGHTYEKLGGKDKALENYRKASTAIAHNSAAAYGVPFAKKRLAALGS
jgi:tetratricopeptide (TPR) repeat protein